MCSSSSARAAIISSVKTVKHNFLRHFFDKITSALSRLALIVICASHGSRHLATGSPPLLPPTSPPLTGWWQVGADIDGEARLDESGQSVSLSSNGSVVAIGAYLNDGSGSNASHVRVYAYDDVSSSWIQRGGDTEGEAAGDESGVSISLSSNGALVAIGARQNSGSGTRAGHVRVWSSLKGFDKWINSGTLLPSEQRGKKGKTANKASKKPIIVNIGNDDEDDYNEEQEGEEDEGEDEAEDEADDEAKDEDGGEEVEVTLWRRRSSIILEN